VTRLVRGEYHRVDQVLARLTGAGRDDLPNKPISAFRAGRDASPADTAVTAGGDGILKVKVRCLIVDDNPRFLRAARSLLEHEGISVVGVASNSAEALQRADELQPDVTLVDIDLGGESGFELATRLRQATPRRSRIILISTRSREDYGDLIAGSRARGFLTKTALSAGAIQRLLADAG
jgi:two-component system, NarL family, nitrate/nitrite response regulator NarL